VGPHPLVGGGGPKSLQAPVGPQPLVGGGGPKRLQALVGPQPCLVEGGGPKSLQAPVGPQPLVGTEGLEVGTTGSYLEALPFLRSAEVPPVPIGWVRSEVLPGILQALTGPQPLVGTAARYWKRRPGSSFGALAPAGLPRLSKGGRAPVGPPGGVRGIMLPERLAAPPLSPSPKSSQAPRIHGAT
jgi:hypothetical protein